MLVVVVMTASVPNLPGSRGAGPSRDAAVIPSDRDFERLGFAALTTKGSFGLDFRRYLCFASLLKHRAARQARKTYLCPCLLSTFQNPTEEQGLNANIATPVV